MRRGLIIAISAIVVSAPIAAEPTAEDAYQYRESIMYALKGHAGAISMITRGLAGDASRLSGHADAIASISKELHSVFQEGSNVEDSEALSAIWDEPEKFAEAVAKAEEAMANLSAAAADNNVEVVERAFRKVGEACKGCHDSFREEHEH